MNSNAIATQFYDLDGLGFAAAPPAKRTDWGGIINQGFQYGRDWLNTYRERRGMAPVDAQAEAARLRAELLRQRLPVPSDDDDAAPRGRGRQRDDGGDADVSVGFGPGGLRLGGGVTLSPTTLLLIAGGVYLLFREPPKRGRG